MVLFLFVVVVCVSIDGNDFAEQVKFADVKEEVMIIELSLHSMK